MTTGERLLKQVHAAHRLGRMHPTGERRKAQRKRLAARVDLRHAPPVVKAAYAYGLAGLPAYGRKET